MGWPFFRFQLCALSCDPRAGPQPWASWCPQRLKIQIILEITETNVRCPSPGGPMVKRQPVVGAAKVCEKSPPPLISPAMRPGSEHASHIRFPLHIMKLYTVCVLFNQRSHVAGTVLNTVYPCPQDDLMSWVQFLSPPCRGGSSSQEGWVTYLRLCDTLHRQAGGGAVFSISTLGFSLGALGTLSTWVTCGGTFHSLWSITSPGKGEISLQLFLSILSGLAIN